MPKPVVSTEPSSHSRARKPADPSNQAPVPPLPWLFQKGNTYGRRRKHHRSRMAKYIQEQTMSESMNVGSWLAVAAGQPFPMERTVRLPRTSEQYAVAVGTATPEQRKIAEKQRRFLVVKEPYYPTVEDIKEAMNWLALRGFGKAPQTVPIESDQTTGLPIMFRKRAPGTDPASKDDGVIDGMAKALPGGVPRRTRPVADPRTRRNPLRDRDSLIPRDITGHHGTTPSADPSNPAPVPPFGRAPWLFQKGNRYGQRRKPHKGGMAKYIQEQTMSGSMRSSGSP